MKKSFTLGTILFLVFALAIPALYAQKDVPIIGGKGTIESQDSYNSFDFSLTIIGSPRPFAPLPQQAPPAIIGRLQISSQVAGEGYNRLSCFVVRTLVPVALPYISCGEDGGAIFYCIEELDGLGSNNYMAVNFNHESTPDKLIIYHGPGWFENPETFHVTEGSIDCVN